MSNIQTCTHQHIIANDVCEFYFPHGMDLFGFAFKINKRYYGPNHLKPDSYPYKHTRAHMHIYICRRLQNLLFSWKHCISWIVIIFFFFSARFFISFSHSHSIYSFAFINGAIWFCVVRTFFVFWTFRVFLSYEFACSCFLHIIYKIYAKKNKTEMMMMWWQKTRRMKIQHTVNSFV